MRALGTKRIHIGYVKMFHHIEHQQRCGTLAIGGMLQHIYAFITALQGCPIGGFSCSKIYHAVAAANSFKAGNHIFGDRAGVKAIAAMGGDAF